MNSLQNRPPSSKGADGDPAPSRRERAIEVAVIGAGISGLVCARLLAKSGHHVRVFDKARGPGGRMATRRAGPLHFDHGAQYFTVRDPRFRHSVETWETDGLVARWTGSLAVIRNGEVTLKDDSTERWVGVPGMSAVCHRLMTGLDVNFGVRIVHLAAHRWRFALPVNPLAEPCLFDRELAVAACGDWAGGPRVEGAFLSGCAAAERILELGPQNTS